MKLVYERIIQIRCSSTLNQVESLLFFDKETQIFPFHFRYSKICKLIDTLSKVLNNDYWSMHQWSSIPQIFESEPDRTLVIHGYDAYPDFEINTSEILDVLLDYKKFVESWNVDRLISEISEAFNRLKQSPSDYAPKTTYKLHKVPSIDGECFFGFLSFDSNVDEPTFLENLSINEFDFSSKDPEVDKSSAYWGPINWSEDSFQDFKSHFIDLEIIWKTKIGSKVLKDKLDGFLSKYMLLCKKYQILLPMYKPTSKSTKDLLQLFLKMDKKKSPNSEVDQWEILNFLYYSGGKEVFPTKLFLYKENRIVFREILNYYDLQELKDFKGEENYYIPVEIRFRRNDNTNPSLVLSIANDIFFEKLDNYRTQNFYSRNDMDSLAVDNSELAYLNTPRINSFLRDLKILCFEYGASGIQLEGLVKSDVFTEEGFLLDGEVLFYEDIYDLLSVEFRLIEFENSKLELDDTNYMNFIGNKT